MVIVTAAIAVAAMALMPVDHTVAFPTREGGNCGGSSGTCHPFRTASFITVTGLPDGTYTPSTAYVVTISLTDSNGATGENNFNFILTGAGGTLTTTDPNAEINSATQASANDLVTPMTVSTWTITWTAPASGSVTIDTWAVVSMTGATLINAPYDHTTVTLTDNTAIPEFPAILIPVLGIGVAVVVAAKMKKKSE